MRIRDISAFLYVCRYGSIRKAAEELFITPQGLSKQIQILEKRVGAPLLTRNANGICLTEYGVIFKKYAESVNERTKRMEAAIQKQWYKTNHLVEFACSRGLLGAFLYTYFEDLRLRNPGIEISVTEAEDCAVHARVLAEDWVIGIAPTPPDARNFQVDALRSYRYVLLAARDRPIAGKTAVDAGDLRGESLILQQKEYMAYHAVLEECRMREISPRDIIQVAEATMAIRLCAMNKGVAVLPEFLMEGLAPVGVSIIPFDEGFRRWDAVLLTRKDGMPSESAVLLKEYLKRAVGNDLSR